MTVKNKQVGGARILERKFRNLARLSRHRQKRTQSLRKSHCLWHLPKQGKFYTELMTIRPKYTFQKVIRGKALISSPAPLTGGAATALWMSKVENS